MKSRSSREHLVGEAGRPSFEADSDSDKVSLDFIWHREKCKTLLEEVREAVRRRDLHQPAEANQRASIGF